MSPTSYQAALPRVIPSLLSATLIIIPYSNSFVKRVRKVFLQRKQRAKTRLLTFFPENQQPRQFTPLREGRPARAVALSTTIRFQFTPLREGRHAVGAFAGRRAHFNSRPSARGDELLPRTHVKAVIFQFTPLREGRPARAVALSTTIRFQFTPLREGRELKYCHPPNHAASACRPSRRGVN